MSAIDNPTLIKMQLHSPVSRQVTHCQVLLLVTCSPTLTLQFELHQLHYRICGTQGYKGHQGH